MCVLECSGYSRGEYLWIKVRRIERVRNGMWKANMVYVRGIIIRNNLCYQLIVSAWQISEAV